MASFHNYRAIMLDYLMPTQGLDHQSRCKLPFLHWLNLLYRINAMVCNQLRMDFFQIVAVSYHILFPARNHRILFHLRQLQCRMFHMILACKVATHYLFLDGEILSLDCR